MSLIPCPGRIPVNNNNKKWYTLKNRTCFYYTCCEECYTKNIKGTNMEDNYKENLYEMACTCDYNIFKSNCNFVDTSQTKKNIRVSIIDDYGKRQKKTMNTDELKYKLPKNISCRLYIEKLFENENENSFISMDSLYVNDKKYMIPLISTKLCKYYIEIPISLKSVFPELSENEIDKIDNIELRFTINKYEIYLPQTINIIELEHKENGDFTDVNGINLLNQPNNEETEYRGFISFNVYKHNLNEKQEFKIMIKHNDHEEKSDNKEIFLIEI